jgi:hypothetical protein
MLQNLILLLLHGLLAVGVLGGLTHQWVACMRRGTRSSSSFIDRYAAVNGRIFVDAIIVMYMGVFVLGAVIYPAYRVDVRIPLEEMMLGWAVGLFELKEHFGGIGAAILPLYRYVWLRQEASAGPNTAQTWLTSLLAAIVWFDFISGHVINNIRGL